MTYLIVGAFCHVVCGYNLYVKVFSNEQCYTSLSILIWFDINLWWDGAIN